jgi:hypothetical protein
VICLVGLAVEDRDREEFEERMRWAALAAATREPIDPYVYFPDEDPE